MTRQITVRLADELVEFIDRQVEHGVAPSRASVVAQALDQQQRRDAAARDAAILAGLRPGSDADDLDGLARYTARTPMDDLA